jgi:6-pyruvoyl-tetrahydropterin synthase
MYTVCVRDHVMIAHSFKGEVFGPARRLHGATYVVDVEIRRSQLDEQGLVVDIARASQALASVLADLNYRNLDEEPAFSGCNTTTEYLARVIFERFVQRIRAGELACAPEALDSLRVTLHESHVAWAAFESSLTPR